MALIDQTLGGYDDTANQLGLDDQEAVNTPTSNFWGHLDGDDLGAAVIDRVKRFHQWQAQNGLLKGWRLKLNYYYNNYRADPEIPHLSVMQNFGANGEYSFVSMNHLRSLLKTVLSSVTQNPPNFETIAINADADATEAAALYKGVLDYYTRELRLTSKITKALETSLVVDQAFILTEWDYFAPGGDSSDDSIWKGAPTVKVLNPWDVTYDVTKTSWGDQDYVIVRDWQDKERTMAAFPELRTEIDGCQLRAQVEHSGGDIDRMGRYEMSAFSDISNDIQIYKLFFRPSSWMPQGRFCMVLENGTLLYESPTGLIYPKIPVERIVPDEQVDVLLGYSPINEMLSPQEAINSLISAITTNTNNYANQLVAVAAGTDLNPRTLADGQRVIEYPPGSHPPVGINLTAIPDSLFAHLKELMSMMQEIPAISNSSRGQAPGANSTGAAMLFLNSQTSANQGTLSDNYASFCASCMTSLLHVIRTFGRTEKTINIMGKTVASKVIVLSVALKDFDEVIVSNTNPIMATAQGKMALAQQMLQYGNCTPAQVLQVITSGNLGPAVDEVREIEYELAKENEWLLEGQPIMVSSLDDHGAHIKKHSRLLSTPWLRNGAVADKLQISNADEIQKVIQDHISQHVQMMAQDTGNQAAQAGPPGQPPPPGQPALQGHPPPPAPSEAAPINAPAQASGVSGGPELPKPPGMPAPPG